MKKYRRWTRKLKNIVRKEEHENEECSFALHPNCIKFQKAGISPLTSPPPHTLGESKFGTTLRCRLHDKVCDLCWFMVVDADDLGIDQGNITLKSWLDEPDEPRQCFACHDIAHNFHFDVDRKLRKKIYENAESIVKKAGKEITTYEDAKPVVVDSESAGIRAPEELTRELRFCPTILL